MENLQAGDLTIEVFEGDDPPTVRLDWLGMSNERQPETILGPFPRDGPRWDGAGFADPRAALRAESSDSTARRSCSIIKLIQEARKRGVRMLDRLRSDAKVAAAELRRAADLRQEGWAVRDPSGGARMSAALSLEVELKPEWRNITRASEAVALLALGTYGDDDLRDTLAMVSGELLENAIKYANPQTLVKLTIRESASDIVVEVTNAVVRAEEVQRLAERLAWLTPTRTRRTRGRPPCRS